MSEYYFGRGESVLRMVMEHKIVGMLYGSRALIVGALEPMAFTGTYAQSRVTLTGDYYGRLLKTQQAFETVIFEPRCEADRTLRKVAAMHSLVKGSVKESVGPDYPPGSTYDAADPWLALWTMSVLCESAYALYTTYVRELSDEESELFWEDWVRFGELFGMPAGAAPATWAEFREMYFGYIHSDRPNVLPMANKAAVASVNLPATGPAQVVSRVMYLLLAATLPARVRDLHGLRWGIAEQISWLPLREAVRMGNMALPASIRRGPVGERSRAALIPLREREAALMRKHQERLQPPT